MYDKLEPEMTRDRTRRQIALSIIAGEAFDEKCYDPRECARYGVTPEYKLEVIRTMYQPPRPQLRLIVNSDRQPDFRG